MLHILLCFAYGVQVDGQSECNITGSVKEEVDYRNAEIIQGIPPLHEQIQLQLLHWNVSGIAYLPAPINHGGVNLVLKQRRAFFWPKSHVSLKTP